MNVQYSLFRELVLYVFELSYNATKANNKICWAKGKPLSCNQRVQEILFGLQEPRQSDNIM